MSERKIPRERLQISKFKLNALLDITVSINANLPKEELLSKYEDILRHSLGIGKILIFKRSDAWECLLNGGFSPQMGNIDVESQLLDIKEIVNVTPDLGFEGVDIIIPVYNNDICLAYVLIGDIDEEGEGMSPVVKHLNFIQTISNIIIVAIENKRLFLESLRQEAIRKELDVAARIQKALIPDESKMPNDPDLVVNGFYYPHYEVGGDYYDCINLSETKTGICIADVSGKGIAAAMLMSNFQASFRALFTHDARLETLIRKLNEIVTVNSGGERFITFFVARFDRQSGLLEYVNAAHNPPVLYNTVTGEVSHLRASCVGLGMLDEIPEFKRSELKIRDYSKLVCYTDGLSELKGDDGKDLGTGMIVQYISNTEPVGSNISKLLRDLGLPHDNPNTFDDVSLIAADLQRQDSAYSY
jgi:sigma-B regulation protein RsbU (phosphoserine phosphatase)